MSNSLKATLITIVSVTLIVLFFTGVVLYPPMAIAIAVPVWFGLLSFAIWKLAKTFLDYYSPSGK